MTTKIDRHLSLVIPVERDDGSVVYVHSTPISRQVFEANYLVLAKTFAKVFTGGLGIAAGPRVAYLALRDEARDQGIDLDKSLFNEVRRLTNLLVPTDAGYDMVPYQEAVAKALINADDAAEVDNAIAFFTVVSAMQKRPVASATMEGAALLWGAQISLLPLTEFITSLKTSTKDETTGATVPPLSIPH